MDVSKYYNINYFLTFSLAVCFNSTLIYFIKRNPSSKLKNYSSVLIQGAILDLIISFVYFALQPYFECTQGYLFYESIAPWMFVVEPYLKNKWSIAVATVNMLGNFSNPIQALYRYLHFCSSITLKPLQIFGIYCACFLCVSVIATLHVLPFQPAKNLPEAFEVITELPHWSEHKDGNLYACSLLNILLISSVVAMLLTLNAGSISLMFFNSRVNSNLKKLQVHMASKTIQLQKQIAKQLMLQFCLPGFLICLGFVSAISLILLPDYGGGFIMLMFCPFQWVPVLNPVITIVCIADYRRQLFRILKRNMNNVGSTTVVAGHIDSKSQVGTVALGF